MSKVLVICFSRSGNTRAFGAAIAERLHADFEAITEPNDRSGVSGYIRSLIDAVFTRSVRIDPPQHDVSLYDIVIVGTPIWAGTVSAPVRTWLALHRRKLPHLAFFCTERVRGDSTAFRDMTRLVGKQPVARCAVRSSFDGHEKKRIVDIFIERIERRLSRIDNLMWAA
jgi:flavodoxin